MTDIENGILGCGNLILFTNNSIFEIKEIDIREVPDKDIQRKNLFRIFFKHNFKKEYFIGKF